ncbi:MAG TPA: hypothetical protein VGV91_02730 [Rubrobacter sp.]|nr:hypothetical protein [Rubrobacter sp.]
MKILKRHLSKLLLGATIGAVLGALTGWLLMGEGVVVYAILGACVLAALATLYDPNVVVHSSPNSRGETSPYDRDSSTAHGRGD